MLTQSRAASGETWKATFSFSLPCYLDIRSTYVQRFCHMNLKSKQRLLNFLWECSDCTITPTCTAQQKVKRTPETMIVVSTSWLKCLSNCCCLAYSKPLGPQPPNPFQKGRKATFSFSLSCYLDIRSTYVQRFCHMNLKSKQRLLNFLWECSDCTITPTCTAQQKVKRTPETK